jgi:hypothetical protein
MKLTLTKTEEFPPIAKLVDTKNPKAVEKLVYISSEDGNDEDEIMKAEASHKFVPLPFVEKNQRDALFISAPSGAGKSRFSAEYILNMRKLKQFKKAPVILFSASRNDDPAYKDIKNFHKVDIYSPELGLLDIQDLENSICLFDDFDQVSDKSILKFLRDILKQILELGRKLNISVICIVHDTLQGNHTKPLIFECNSVVLYPKFSFRTASQFLKNYLGFGKEEILSLKKRKGRFVFIRKSIPLYQITEDEVKVL